MTLTLVSGVAPDDRSKLICLVWLKRTIGAQIYTFYDFYVCISRTKIILVKR